MKFCAKGLADSGMAVWMFVELPEIQEYRIKLLPRNA